MIRDVIPAKAGIYIKVDPRLRGDDSLNFEVMKEKGSVLILVLWSIFFLGMLAVAVNAAVWPRVNFANHFVSGTKMNWLARAAVKRAILETVQENKPVFDSLDDAWSRSDGVFKDQELGDGTFSVIHLLPVEDGQSESGGDPAVHYGLLDEESKISLNKAPLSLLKGLLEQAAGMGSMDAQTMAECIVDWRDADNKVTGNGAEDNDYITMSPGYHCKNADFENAQELMLVKGMTPEVYEKIQKYITIYSSGRVNINTCGRTVLASLGMGSSLVEKIASFRNGIYTTPDNGVGHVFEDAGSISQSLNQAVKLSADETAEMNKAVGLGILDVQSENFGGKALGRLRGGKDSVGIDFVFNRKTRKIVYWRE